MRPTGKLHLGHLVGALQNWTHLQDAYDCFYFVADWHALTSHYADTGDIVENALDNVADWIGAGLGMEDRGPLAVSGTCEWMDKGLWNAHREFDLLYTYPGDVVLDPHNGSGTTTTTAQLLGRQFVGIDANPEYCRTAEARVMRPNAERQFRREAT